MDVDLDSFFLIVIQSEGLALGMARGIPLLWNAFLAMCRYDAMKCGLLKFRFALSVFASDFMVGVGATCCP